MLGDYTLGFGRSDKESNSDLQSKDEFYTPFHSYCWEIIEESSENFIVNDVIMEWTQGWEVINDTSFTNNQFKI